MSWDYDALRGIVDNISLAIKDIIALLGSSTEADTILYYIEQNKTRIDGIDDVDYEKFLELANDKAKTEAQSLPYLVYSILARTLSEAVLTNESKSFSEHWAEGAEGEEDADTRIPCYFADLFKGRITPSLVFPKENIKLAAYNIETEVYTDDQEIDTSKYGGAVLKCVVTVEIGAGDDALVTILGKDENGSKWEGTCTIPAESPVGTEVEVTPNTLGTYCADVTEVAVAGAAVGAFDVKSKEDRALTA